MDCKGLLKSAIRDDNPVVFLEHEILYGHIHEVGDEFDDIDFTIPIGKAAIVREGDDVTITAFSFMVKHAIDAAEILSQNYGIKAEIIDLRTIRPLDKDCILSSVKKTNRLVTVEEGWAFSGIGAEICAIVVDEIFDYLDCEPKRVSSVDVPLPYAANLEKLALPQVANIVDSVLSVVAK